MGKLLVPKELEVQRWKTYLIGIKLRCSCSNYWLWIKLLAMDHLEVVIEPVSMGYLIEASRFDGLDTFANFVLGSENVD